MMDPQLSLCRLLVGDNQADRYTDAQILTAVNESLINSPSTPPVLHLCGLLTFQKFPVPNAG